jgi:hypothetical protein
MRVLLASLVLFLVSCASNKLGPSYVKAHPELDSETKRRILAHEVVEGMTQEQVIASLGGPIDVTRIANDIEHWDYRSSVLIFRNGVLVQWVDKKLLY